MALDAEDILFRDTPPKSKKALQQWLIYFLGLDFADCVVDKEFSNCSPLDMIWLLYKSAMFDQDIQKALFVGSRGSGKTLAAAAIEFLLLHFAKRGVVHIGAIEKQAKRSYAYFQDFFRKDGFTDYVSSSTMEKTVLNNGMSLEVLPATLQAVNGPHQSVVTLDELDTVQDILAYKDISGIPIPTIDGKPALEISISTRKSTFGLVQQEIDNAAKTGLQVYYWNHLEVTERCKDDRSGTLPTPYYVNIEQLDAITHLQWSALSNKQREQYKRYEMYDGCGKCKLAAACRGYLKNQTSNSKYLRKIEHTIQQIKAVSPEWALAQFLCAKPSPQGLVFPTFMPEKSIKSYKQMMEKWTGEPVEKELTLTEFVAIAQNKFRCYPVMGVDFGFTHPAVALLIFMDRMDNIYVVREFAATGMDGAELALHLKTHWQPYYKIEMVYPDIEDPANIKLLRGADFTCASTKKDSEALGEKRYVNKDVGGGIETIRKFMKVPGTQDTKLFIHPSCKTLLDNLKKYHYKSDKQGNPISDEPVREDDDAICALRYPLHSIYGGSEALLNLDIEESNKTILPNTLLNAPSAGMMANQAGIIFNDNEDEYDAIKKAAEEFNKKLFEKRQNNVKSEDIEEDMEGDEDGFSFIF